MALLFLKLVVFLSMRKYVKIREKKTQQKTPKKVLNWSLFFGQALIFWENDKKKVPKSPYFCPK